MDSLVGLSIEELMSIEVISESRKPKKLIDTSSAAYVITSEDIRRSGARTIPEALRLAPGVEVAHIDANKWAVTIRGFNGRFSSKLMVLIDGRSVYSPLFGGVYWEKEDLLLDDIERIEIIRGPGASLWGANAVNGIINIITKSSWKTQGVYAQAGGGNEERGFVGLRLGSKIGKDLAYRVYGKFFNRDNFAAADGIKSNDDWYGIHTGFKVDWDITNNDQLTFNGNFYSVETGQSFTFSQPTPPFSTLVQEDAEFFGGSISAIWIRNLSPTSATKLHFFYTHDNQDNSSATFFSNVVDLDFQHNFLFKGINDIVWGIRYRLIQEDHVNQPALSFDDNNKFDKLFSGFFHDEISLLNEKVVLTLGSKFEINDYTGFEVQPTARILVIPTEKQRVWAAVSRAVKTPSIFQDEVRVNTAFFPDPVSGELTTIQIQGDPDLDSEELWAIELGYRVQPFQWLFIDLASFLNLFDSITSLEPGTPFTVDTPIHQNVLPIRFDNKIHGKVYGFEISSSMELTQIWKINASYSFLKIDLEKDSSSNDMSTTFRDEDANPISQIKIQSYLDLPFNLEFDSFLYYSSRLDVGVSDYYRLDLRLGWEPIKGLELSVVGQNLLDEHVEFIPAFLNLHTKTERSVFGVITWRY